MQDWWEFAEGEDIEFTEWIERHPEGYVLNLRGGEDDAMLHRASCGHFKDDDPLNWVRKRKICSATLFMLDRWLTEKLDDRQALSCGDCMKSASI